MNDVYFGRGVILLAEHNDEGSFGMVLNKPLKQDFNDVVLNFPAFDGKLFLGGPVERNSLFFIHTIGDLIEGSKEIAAGYHWGGDINIVKDMIADGLLNSTNIRFSVGYSGWSPNQLGNEIKRNSWAVIPKLDKKLLTKSPESLWKNQVDLLGKDFNHWNNFPNDPNLN